MTTHSQSSTQLRRPPRYRLLQWTPPPVANPGSSEGGQPPAEKTQLPDAVTGNAWLQGTSVKLENTFKKDDILFVSKGGSILSSESFKAQASV